MPPDMDASWMLAQEARALSTRLARVKPFALHETMVPAASISPAAQTAIERFLADGRRELRNRIDEFLMWLEQPDGKAATAAAAQERFTILRLRFNDILAQFDLFADALTQRSEHETGIWLSGLDAVAADAVELPRRYYEAPPIVCYLDRGPGAAIRRARTRLPGGGENPVAIVRVPRERMIGAGIASSLVHEVGHQGSALLDLANSFRPTLQELQDQAADGDIWRFFERWISEILADLWGVARVGIASTLGLISVVSLPRYFVFRVSMSDPHPIPWIRVKLSCAIGAALYPHRQWDRVDRLWESFYPKDSLDEGTTRLLARLESKIPDFIGLLVNHRPESLGGQSLIDALTTDDRRPGRLARFYDAWRASPGRLRRAPPSLVFAVAGQARADGRLSPEAESRLLADMLTYWALSRTLDISATCAVLPAARQPRAAGFPSGEARANVR